MLARSMDPGHDLEGLKRSIDEGISGLRGRWPEPLDTSRLLGLTPYREGFSRSFWRPEIGGRLTRGVENNPMVSASNTRGSLRRSVLCPTAQAQAERLWRGIEIVPYPGRHLGVEYLADSLRDGGFFAPTYQAPCSSWENAAGALNESDQRGMGRFLESCGKS